MTKIPEILPGEAVMPSTSSVRTAIVAYEGVSLLISPRAYRDRFAPA
jgi:hypothetical protein